MSNADMLRTVSSIDDNYAEENCAKRIMLRELVRSPTAVDIGCIDTEGFLLLFYRVIRKIACIVFIKLDCFIFNFSLSCVFKQSGIKDP